MQEQIYMASHVYMSLGIEIQKLINLQFNLLVLILLFDQTCAKQKKTSDKYDDAWKTAVALP